MVRSPHRSVFFICGDGCAVERARLSSRGCRTGKWCSPSPSGYARTVPAVDACSAKSLASPPGPSPPPSAHRRASATWSSRAIVRAPRLAPSEPPVGGRQSCCRSSRCRDIPNLVKQHRRLRSTCVPELLVRTPLPNFDEPEPLLTGDDFTRLQNRKKHCELLIVN